MDFFRTPIWRWIYKDCSQAIAGRPDEIWIHQVHMGSRIPTEFSTTLQTTTTLPTTTQHNDRDNDGEHDETTHDETGHATNELVPNLMFENIQLPENAQLTAEIFETEKIFQTEETFVPTNAQVPVESYAMSHGGGCGPLIKYCRCFCAGNCWIMPV